MEDDPFASCDAFAVFDNNASTATATTEETLDISNEQLTKKRKEPPVVYAPMSRPVPSASSIAAVSRSSISSDYILPETRAFSVSISAISQEVVDIDARKVCTHELAVPKDYVYDADVEAKELDIEQEKLKNSPALTYDFRLDPFQCESILCLQRQQSVLVSAHTSAGKTVVAEYAIAMSLRDKQRVIYTSPIKALSNQKYRELYEKFSDVGLMTGDVTINPSASCLVMTTEILRSMLYRGSEVMREVAWVIFDEIHYMRDKERGVVWEETIIMLPDNTHYVFLSATIPNAREFAEWIAYLHKQPCHVVYTEYRPTPLQHFIYPAGGEGIHLIIDEKGVFREDNFQKAMSAVQDNDNAPKGKGSNSSGEKKRRGQGNEGDLTRLIKMIKRVKLHPVIVFSFSKRECEAYALQLSKAKVSFNTAAERELVARVYENALDPLSDDDKKLPQIEHILPLLKDGIGIHHSGLLPILKEVIEILFSEGLIKALFATETFAMGLNMPAKTVVFTTSRKFDGKETRWVSGGEYIQMSGRAGRRGLDDKGICIMMADEKMEPDIATSLLRGQADPLNSAFHLSYNMVLNLLRVDEFVPETMLQRSFIQFQHAKSAPRLREALRKEFVKLKSIVITDEDSASEYFNIRQQLAKLKSSIKSIVFEPSNCLQFMQPGRLVKIMDGKNDWGWGAVVNFTKKKSNHGGQKQKPILAEEKYVLEVLLRCVATDGNTSLPPQPFTGEGRPDMQVVPVDFCVIDGISSVRINLPKDLRTADKRYTVERSLDEVVKRFTDGIPLLCPIDDMRIDDKALTKAIRKTESLEARLYVHSIHTKEDRDALMKLCNEKAALRASVSELEMRLKDNDSVLHMDELKFRKRVLRRLEYTSDGDVIETKGRVACEVQAADELLLTELVFQGTFATLSAEQIVALLSCFVFQERSDEQVRLVEELAGPLRQMQDTARRIAKVCNESKLPIDEEEYVQSFRSEMMDVCYQWAKGSKFCEICKMTDVFEGNIIRGMRRLDELLRQMCMAAKAIGNNDLEGKFAEASSKIHRDIVFAASLYL